MKMINKVVVISRDKRPPELKIGEKNMLKYQIKNKLVELFMF
jgi:hypothetical protein